MKKILFMLAILATVIAGPGFAQPENKDVLTRYYGVKDALVAGDVKVASQQAGELIKALNAADNELVPANSKKALLADAKKIAAGKDLEKQRKDFAPLSDNMIALVKSSKLTDKPVYAQYCPMKKSSWLSNEKAIKNPYYGSAMLTCGNVSETL